MEEPTDTGSVQPMLGGLNSQAHNRRSWPGMAVPYVVRRGSRRRRGFTLVEMLIVLLVIGMLAAIAAPGLASSRGPAEESTARADLVRLETYLVDRYQEVGDYNASTGGAFVTAASGSFAPSPGNEYAVTPTSSGQGVTLYVRTPAGVLCRLGLGDAAYALTC